MVQEKYDLTGHLQRWSIDADAVYDGISWAGSNRDLFRRELEDMQQHFPYFYLTVSTDTKIRQDGIFCPQCGDLITVAEGAGLSCICCSALYNFPREALLGWIGRIPSLIGHTVRGEFGKSGNVRGRPFLKKVHSRLRRMDDQSSDWLRSQFMTREDKIYFAPNVFAFYPNNWPRSGPRVLVAKEYFDEVLFTGSRHTHSDFHAYSDMGGNFLQLCIFGTWHQMTMRSVLQQRIVTKIIIDLMVADLVAVGKLNEVVGSLGTSVHSLYNWICKSGRSERFQQEYNRHVQIT